MALRDYEQETKDRVAFIRDYVESAGAAGIVYGNSGGKDCTLASILCKMACENTLGVMLPCQSSVNHGQDKTDALAAAAQFNIETRELDLGEIRALFVEKLGGLTELSDNALINLAPRLRMIALYAVAASEGRLVCGTGNRSETYMGYFTKWGDGAYDFNPIADLSVGEVYEFLDHFNAPESIRTKRPSAGLFEGQTDEAEMGISYAAIDDYLLNGNASERDLAIIERYNRTSAHKRRMPATYTPPGGEQK